MNRKQTTEILTKSACSYLLHKGFSCHTEIGLSAHGRLRADVLATDLRGNIIIAEIKSCISDFTQDTKWEQYLKYCDKLYFVVPQRIVPKLQTQLHTTVVGILFLCPNTGYLRSAKPAKTVVADSNIKKQLYIRMAWRNGQSKGNSRRTRYYLDVPD